MNRRAKSDPRSNLRVIAGRWKGRNLEFLDLPGVRPTPNRVRETLFNWLAPHVEGAACLDLFAGSGVLGFEAVSRGAATATLVESDRRICGQIENEILRFGAETIHVVASDARRFVQEANTAYDVVFLDPPFNRGLVQKTLAALAENDRILQPASLIYVEWESETEIAPPPALHWLHRKHASQVQYALLGTERLPGPERPSPASD